MKGIRFNYSRGYVLARRSQRRPKGIPPEDVILLRFRGARPRHKFDIYLRPDEAAAFAAVLAGALWDELVNRYGRRIDNLLATGLLP